jgi:hypothetical protein
VRHLGGQLDGRRDRGEVVAVVASALADADLGGGLHGGGHAGGCDLGDADGDH